MSNRRKISDGLRDRTTTSSGEGITITPPADVVAPRPRKRHVGNPRTPTDAEIDKMALGLADAILSDRAKDARATRD